MAEGPVLNRQSAAPLATAAAGLLCAVTAGALLGLQGVLSGVAAALVVVALFWSSPLPLLLVRGLEAAAGLGLVVLLTSYVLRLSGALLLLALGTGTELLDRRAAGISLIVCALAWIHTRVALLRWPAST